MTILYTSSNTNLKTVNLTAHAVRETVKTAGFAPVHTIVIFASQHTVEGEDLTKNQHIYRKHFGTSLVFELIPLDDDGLATVSNFVQAFKADDDTKIVDITNGQKAITAQLYVAASLLKVTNIFYASLRVKSADLSDSPILGKDYDYLRLPPFTGLPDFAKLSYFDLVFYLEEVDRIFVGVKPDSFLSKTSRDLRKAILSFFDGNSLRSSVSDATTSSEMLIKELKRFLETTSSAKQFVEDSGEKYKPPSDPLGESTYFFKKYDEKSRHERRLRNEDLEALITVPGLLTPFRDFRNLAAHSGASLHEFQPNEVRICINLAIELFRCSRSSQAFWSALVEL